MKCSLKVSTSEASNGKNNRYSKLNFFDEKCLHVSRRDVSLASLVCMFTSIYANDSWSSNYLGTSLINLHQQLPLIWRKQYFGKSVIASNQCKRIYNTASTQNQINTLIIRLLHLHDLAMFQSFGKQQGWFETWRTYPEIGEYLFFFQKKEKVVCP